MRYNFVIISTHTLTWSVTSVRLPFVCAAGDFNSHAHVERDVGETNARPVSVISTHTLTWSVTYAGMA